MKPKFDLLNLIGKKVKVNTAYGKHKGQLESYKISLPDDEWRINIVRAYGELTVSKTFRDSEIVSVKPDSLDIQVEVFESQT